MKNRKKDSPSNKDFSPISKEKSKANPSVQKTAPQPPRTTNNNPIENPAKKVKTPSIQTRPVREDMDQHFQPQLKKNATRKNKSEADKECEGDSDNVKMTFSELAELD